MILCYRTCHIVYVSEVHIFCFYLVSSMICSLFRCELLTLPACGWTEISQSVSQNEQFVIFSDEDGRVMVIKVL